MTLCKAGVVRWKSAAVVHLDIPDGGERLIVYRGLTPVSSDSDRPLTVERRGDTALVRIGTAERYEIVDALIAGG